MALRLQDEPSWVKFLQDAGIPADDATKYADVFLKQRITEATLPELTSEHLNQLQISVLGDVLAILKHAKTLNTIPTPTPVTSTSSNNAAYRPPTTAAKPPEITSEMTHSQFRKVEIDWDVYKKLTRVPDSEIGALLYSACDDAVQNSIINSNVQFFTLSEKKMLETIENIVTKRINTAVHRKNFRNIVQEDETIQNYLTRIRSAAVDCEFVCPECDLDISRVDIKDQFTQGLRNEVLQMDILAKADQLKTIEDVVKHAEAYETALQDQQQLQHQTDAQVNRVSDYKKGKNNSKFSKPLIEHPEPARKTCSGCGSNCHGTKGTPPRHSHCPAWGQTCSSCQKPNHFDAVCRKPAANNQVRALIAHLKYDTRTDMYSNEEELQEISANLTPDVKNSTARPVDIFPDSGANICLGGPKQLDELKLDPSKLRPCHKRVEAVGGSELVCKGWIPIKFEIGSHSTIQPVYFCERVDKLYFSRKACMDMNILPACFPMPMPHTAGSVSSIHDSEATQKLRTPPPPRPKKIPFAPIPANIPKLKQHLIEKFKLSTFLNSDEPFPALRAPPFKLFLKQDAVPYAQHTPIPVPHHLKAAVKAQLDRDVIRGIIKPVPVNTPVIWCAPMVVIEKADGSPRRTIDYQHLNSQCLRQTHYTDSPFNLASQIPPHTKKTVIDAVDGFHSVEVEEGSQHLLIFITEWGRYMPLRLPQGYSASGDAYTHRMDNITKDVKRKLKIVDDSLLYDHSIEESFFHTWDYLTLCAENGIVANVKKFQFCEDTVDFAGLTITPTGITPSEKLISAIRDFPTPRDITGARSWFGLVNQVAWAYSLAPIMAPFREMIKPNKNFYWDSELDRIFEESKKTIVDLVINGVQSFEISRPTCLQTDWSKDGIGYVLLQKHCQCTINSPICCKEGWKLIFAGSRFTKPAESRYAPIEGEALALAWALDHSRMYTLGCPNLLVAVDHKPLLGVFNDRDLQSIKNPRLRSFKEDTLAWRFSIIHCPGKSTCGPDALSRQKIASSLVAIRDVAPDQVLDRHSESADRACQVSSIQTISKLRSVTLDEVRNASRLDEQYQDLIKIINSGFPAKRNLTNPSHLREYWEVRDRMYVLEGIVYMDQRTVIPRLLRKLILDNLHSANQGVTGMRHRANQSVYWPGLDNSIRIHRDNCRDCAERAPSQPPEPLILTPSPDYPFQKICADFFHIGSHGYLSVVDRFSAWLSIFHFKPGQLTSKSVINELRNLFIAYGVSEEISSDGGPQFTSEMFKQFLKDWGVTTRLSSVSYPQSNGRAELAVKAAKRIIHNNTAADGSLNTDNAARAIIQYRNTPLPDLKLSPAQILLHRNLRDGIPAHPSHYRMHQSWVINAEERELAYASRNERITEKYNAHARELPALTVGTDVLVQNQKKGNRWDKQGQIVEVLPNRQYHIRMFPSGRVTLQNRRFIRVNTCAQPQSICNMPLPSFSATPSTPSVTQQPPPPQTDTLRGTPTPATQRSVNATPLESDGHISPSHDTPTHGEAAPNSPMNNTTHLTTQPTPAPKVPRCLKNLMTYNNPGLKEGTVGERR